MFENSLLSFETGEDGFIEFVADLAFDGVVVREARYGVELGDDGSESGGGDVQLLGYFMEFAAELAEFDVGSVLVFEEGDLHFGEADYAEVVSDPDAQVEH
jgi:hypothetical protein